MADDKDAKTTTETDAKTVATKPEEAKDSQDPETKAVETKAAAKKESTNAIPKKFEKLVKELEELSVLDLSELVTTLEDHFNVSAAAPVVAAEPVTGDGNGADNEEEKSEFTVTLTDAGTQKVAVIKAVKEITGLGLGESKAITDSAPSPVMESVGKDEAEEAKEKLEEAGATVELS